MTAVASFIQQHEQLFQRKTAKVCITGGVVGESLFDDSTEYLQPDNTDPNHAHDPAAASFVFERCQALGVGLVILTRSASDVVSVPSFFYDELAALGHPVAVRLRDYLSTAIRCDSM
jgi:inosine-uridine nucleoside N-ribohydrolase